MVCNPQVPRGASEKDWARINNYPVFDNSVFCNPIPLLTISHFISIQTPESVIAGHIQLLRRKYEYLFFLQRSLVY